ncbi:MAG: hypothetical protein WCC06_11955 [Candidatus Aminicenantales bacterium]
MRKKFSLSLIILLACLSFMGLRIKMEHIPRQKIPGSSIIYIPSGKYLKLAAFGYSSLLADLVFLWAIQYYGDYSIPDRFRYFEHIFMIISELDPRYIDSYQVGALIALYDAKDVHLALKLFDLGLAKNPDMWIFPLEAGHYAQMYIKDYDLARDYYKKAMEIEGAPAIAQRLYANAAFKTMDYRTAWETWIEIYRTSQDEQVKKIASNHLYQVKAAVDIRAIKTALQQFREKFRRNPSELAQLVRAGFLPSLFKDFDGRDYLYDPQTGEVTPPIIPWKR